jgi:cytochrome b561
VGLKNTAIRYGAITRSFHWIILVLFIYQYTVANMMLRIERDQTLLGFTQGTLFNWHKSVGLILLLLALLRLGWRKATNLPDWAPTLTRWERQAFHWIERILYTAMLLMPISGYVYTMAGGYGVRLFGIYALPNPFGKIEILAEIGKTLHIITAYMIVLTLVCHVGLVFKHQFVDKDKLLYRMLPFNPQ